MMEAENTESKLGNWSKRTDFKDFSGTGHLQFNANQPNGQGSVRDPLVYRFRINQAGDYRLAIRAHKNLQGARHDYCNDGYARMEGDFGIGTGGPPNMDFLTKDTKIYGGFANDWDWAQRLERGHSKGNAVYRFKAGETYTFRISGRSRRWNIDRIVFYHSSVNGDVAKAVTVESSLVGGTPPPPQSFTLNTSVSGQGTVTKSPEKANYSIGEKVTLTATPATGMVFTGWSGDATGTTNPLEVTMNANRTVNALFMQKMPSGIEKLTIVAAEASAEQNDDHLKELSYDGDPQTRWANDNTPENNWIIFDLGETGIVNVLKLMLNVGETRTYPLKVEVGDSKDSFTEVWNADLPPAVGLNTIVLTEAPGRYVRVSMTGPNSDGSNWFSIFQAEVWGTNQGTSIRSLVNGYNHTANLTPIQGGFTITAPGASAKLEVFNLQGKLMFQKNGVFENSFIPMRQNGVYFLRLSQGDKQINQKFIIQN